MKAHILNTTPCTVSTPSIFQHFSKKRKEERKNESKLTLIPKVTFGLYSVDGIHAAVTVLYKKVVITTTSTFAC